ncbi:hypothetical protein E1B28_009758 [Marasmius oreades]|uniref:Uncharacterized protein n=1 Tax=Marasmius oreades TaxID=181124 RepID=A0A9P7RVS2_9AGAR|nr:uncharacterized protein E1B28_009758 [Marasmius oreades]KAG7090659.1 hypothetical protein E1B28_009758 [Marasmius oreades]
MLYLSAYPTIFDPRNFASAKDSVLSLAVETHKLYYEMDRVVCMGLPAASEGICFLWSTSTRPWYRLVGLSQGPLYNIEHGGNFLPDFIGWTANDELHVLGPSFGGMIAPGMHPPSILLYQVRYHRIPPIKTILSPSSLALVQDWM